MKKIHAIYLIILLVPLLPFSSILAQCDSTYLSQSLEVGNMIGSFVFGSVDISEAQEEEIGDGMHDYMRENFILLESDARLRKLRRMVSKMTPYVKRPMIQYEVHLIQDDELINAFSIAGGHIYVTTGILNWVGSDDELAFILGHELAHVDVGHCIYHVKKSMTIQGWSDYFQIGEYAGAIEQTQTVLGTPFGQPDEYTADQEGAYIAWKAGYDPMKGVDFFRKLSQNETESDEVLDQLIRTHPYSNQRITCLEYFIKNQLGE